MYRQGITAMLQGGDSVKAKASAALSLSYVPDLAREIAGGLRSV